MNNQKLTQRGGTGGAHGSATRVDAYEPWEHVTRNEPALSSIAEPLTLSLLTGPGPVLSAVRPEESDLTTNAGTGHAAMGQRILITGRVVDESNEPVPGVLIEIWQANAAGRYTHSLDSWNAPLDPNFVGKGRCVTDAHGVYRFLTVRPGAYPWKVETNEWRPAHIHLSLMGPSLASRLVTQLYFADDPHFPLDSIFQALPEGERARVICQYDHKLTERDWAMGYRFDVVLRGPFSTPFEPQGDNGGHQ
jgi:protocatechuate 3,4-dioxygenase, beta subunit